MERNFVLNSSISFKISETYCQTRTKLASSQDQGPGPDVNLCSSDSRVTRKHYVLIYPDLRLPSFIVCSPRRPWCIVMVRHITLFYRWFGYCCRMEPKWTRKTHVGICRYISVLWTDAWRRPRYYYRLACFRLLLASFPFMVSRLSTWKNLSCICESCSSSSWCMSIAVSGFPLTGRPNKLIRCVW